VGNGLTCMRDLGVPEADNIATTFSSSHAVEIDSVSKIE
jgi:hypothetical protein